MLQHSPESVSIGLLTAPQFYSELLDDVASTSTGDRVSITAMSIEPDAPLVGKLMNELGNAAIKGVDVNLAIDAYTLLLDSSSPIPGPLWAKLPFGQSRFHHRQKSIEQLDKLPNAGARIINTPDRAFSNPIAGRSHLKWTLVNDEITISNGNLTATRDSDITLKMTDQATADWLQDITTGLIQTGNTRDTLGSQDQVRQIDPDTHALLDAGVAGQSIILDEALSLIDEADEWLVLATQYFPHKEVLKRVIKAHERGVNIRMPYNPLNAMSLLEKLPEFFAQRHARDLPEQLLTGPKPDTSRKIHIKALANEQKALIGSHNFDPRGVKLGTAELSILREDPNFALEVGNFVMRQIGLPELRPTYAADLELVS